VPSILIIHIIEIIRNHRKSKLTMARIRHRRAFQTPNNTNTNNTLLFLSLALLLTLISSSPTPTLVAATGTTTDDDDGNTAAAQIEWLRSKGGFFSGKIEFAPLYDDTSKISTESLLLSASSASSA